jgi:hypothetical protein
MEPDRGVEELDEELGSGAKAGGVRGTKVVGGVVGEEVGEIIRRRVVATVDSGEALWELRGGGGVAGGVGGIDGAGGGGDPVLGEVGVGGGECGHRDVPAHLGGEFVEGAAAEIGAPHAIRREA